MDNISFNIQENFQDNGVDYAEGERSNTILSPLVTGGNPEFNHQAPTLWKYLGINNMNNLQTECGFKCVDDGLKCAGNCSDFDKKCNYKCASETLNCVKDCMDLRPTVMVEEAIEEEEMVEVEEKAERVKKPPPSSYDHNSGMYASYMSHPGNSFTVTTEYGIYPNLADRRLKEEERNEELNQYSGEMR